MTQALRALSYFDVVIDGQLISGGSRSKYKEFTVGDAKFDQTKVVAFGPSGTTWDAWGHTAEDSVSDFDYCWIESDLAGCLAEFTVDKGGEVGTVCFALGLIADFPLVIPTKLARALHTADFATGANDSIERIRIHNPSTTTNANVRVALFT